jgi:hypothetical protein
MADYWRERWKRREWPESATKKCADCAERILTAAKVCKYCGYRFAPPTPSP